MKNYLFCFYALLVGVFVAVTSCKSAKYSFKAPNDFAVQIERTACFGTCPIFVMNINNKGEVDYKGIKFVKNEGHFTKRLPDATFKAIVEQVQNSKIWELNDSYDNQGISDLPSLIFSATSAGKQKKILCRYGCPAEITTLVRSIEGLVGEEGYTKLREVPEE
jgi:predicted nucleic acid-binding Zn finger protein